MENDNEYFSQYLEFVMDQYVTNRKEFEEHFNKKEGLKLPINAYLEIYLTLIMADVFINCPSEKKAEEFLKEQVNSYIKLRKIQSNGDRK